MNAPPAAATYLHLPIPFINIFNAVGQVKQNIFNILVCILIDKHNDHFSFAVVVVVCVAATGTSTAPVLFNWFATTL